SEFLPDIDEWITTYLTQASLSIQWQEIAQAIWYTSQRVNNIQDLVGVQLNSIEKVDLNAVDAPAILIQELLSSTEQIELESLTRQYPFIIGLGNKQNVDDNEQSFLELSFCLPEISFSDIHAKVNYCKAYVTANGLLKKTIQIGLDAGSINEKNIEQQKNEDEDISNSSSSDEDFVAVENPIVHSRREGQKARKPTQCQQCQNTGHNKTGCEAWHKRRASHIYINLNMNS
ncbi:21375_t:CDS:2, partial [Gigaspora rosea]